MDFKVGDKVLVITKKFDRPDRQEFGKIGIVTEVVKVTKRNYGRCIKVTFPTVTFPGYGKSDHTSPYTEDELRKVTKLDEALK